MDAVSIFGTDGYYVYFRILEIMADELDVENPGQNTFLIKTLRKKLQISIKKTLKILKFFEEKKRIFWSVSDNGCGQEIHLNCPKLKDLCDKYTEDTLRSKREVTSKSLPSIEEEVEEEYKPPIVPLTKLDQEFDQFWKAYPRKVGKLYCLKIWKDPKKRKKRPGIDIILKAIEKQKRSELWTRDNGKYIPNPSTWLNQGRWDDEIGNGQDLEFRFR